MDRVRRAGIESIIRAEIDNYKSRFKNSDEGFIKSWPDSYIIFGWLVSISQGGKLDSHMHDTGWLTGSVYINVPPKSGLDSGSLVLSESEKGGQAETKKSGRRRVIDVATGSLWFFPSSLHHHTVPFKGDDNRIVLAFDVIPKT